MGLWAVDWEEGETGSFLADAYLHSASTGTALTAQFSEENPDIKVEYRSTPWSNWYQTFATAIGAGTATEEFPVFQRVSVKKGKSVAFLGLDTQDTEEAASKFLRGHPLSYPSYQDLDGNVRNGHYGLSGTPDTIFYDRKAKVAFVHQGPYRSDADLAADIKRYLDA